MDSVGATTASLKLFHWQTAVVVFGGVFAAVAPIDRISVLVVGSLSMAAGSLFCWLFRRDPGPLSAEWQAWRMRRDPVLFRAYRAGGPVAWRFGLGLFAGLGVRVWLGL